MGKNSMWSGFHQRRNEVMSRLNEGAPIGARWNSRCWVTPDAPDAPGVWVPPNSALPREPPRAPNPMGHVPLFEGWAQLVDKRGEAKWVNEVDKWSGPGMDNEKETKKKAEDEFEWKRIKAEDGSTRWRQVLVGAEAPVIPEAQKTSRLYHPWLKAAP